MSSPNTCEAPIARRQGKRGGNVAPEASNSGGHEFHSCRKALKKSGLQPPEVKARIELFGSQ
jgi:hypothetical protein